MSGRSRAEGTGNPLQYSCLEHPTDRGEAWWTTVYGVTRNWTGLDDYHLREELLFLSCQPSAASASSWLTPLLKVTLARWAASQGGGLRDWPPSPGSPSPLHGVSETPQLPWLADTLLHHLPVPLSSFPVLPPHPYPPKCLPQPASPHLHGNSWVATVVMSWRSHRGSHHLAGSWMWGQGATAQGDGSYHLWTLQTVAC